MKKGRLLKLTVCALNFVLLLPLVLAQEVNQTANPDSIKIRTIPKFDITKTCKTPEYPKAALRSGLHGTTVLSLGIDDDGKVENFELQRSSGWKFLDLSVMRAIAGCQVLPAGKYSSYRFPIRYIWQIDGRDETPTLQAETCAPSDLLRVATESDKTRGIVVGAVVDNSGDVSNAGIEWGSKDSALDQASIAFVKSCKSEPVPGFRNPKLFAVSVRLIEKNPSEVAAATTN